MTHVLAIARREIEERAFVFVAAIAIALVSLVALVLPHGSFSDRRGAVVILGFFLGVAFTWSLALILGATLVGRELSEKRLSFYLTRPVSGSAVWFGKLLAALVLLAVSFVIVHAFPLGIGGSEWQTMSTISRRTAVVLVVAIAVILMLAAHVLSTWIRSASPILAADFVAAVVVIGLFMVTLAPLLVANAFAPAGNVIGLYVVAILIACIGGGAWQLSRGRIDARRSHRELSAFLWVIVGLTAISAFGYSRWVLGATPRELRFVSGIQRGGMIEVFGTARGYHPEFIVNPATGCFVHGSQVVAAAGNTAAAVVPTGALMNVRRIVGGSAAPMDASVVVTRMDSLPRTIAVLPVNGRVTTLGVSTNGSRLAVVSDAILTIYDTGARKALASTKLSTDRFAQLQFLSDSVMRAFVPFGDVLRVRDFDLRTRTWRDVAGPFQLQNQYQYTVAGPLLLTRSEKSAEIHDLQNPAADQLFPLSPDNSFWRMSDGRLAVYHRGQPAYVEIRRNGVQQRLLHFSHEADGVRVAGEIGRGKLLVSVYSRGGRRWDPTTYIIDADSGAIRQTFPHAMAAVTWGPGASSSADRYRTLFHRDTGKIDVIDLQTGAVRPLFD